MELKWSKKVYARFPAKSDIDVRYTERAQRKAVLLEETGRAFGEEQRCALDLCFSLLRDELAVSSNEFSNSFVGRHRERHPARWW